MASEVISPDIFFIHRWAIEKKGSHEIYRLPTQILALMNSTHEQNRSDYCVDHTRDLFLLIL